MSITPNYLYPLAETKNLQWTRQVVKGEKSAKTPRKINSKNAEKKEIVKNIIKDNTKGKVSTKVNNRALRNPFARAKLPEDPMSNMSPVPGNAMHLSPSDKKNYTGYGSIQK